MCRDFRLLIDSFDRFKPYYLPIDSPKRQHFLDRINEGLGMALVSDWAPQGTDHKNYNTDYRNIDAAPCVQVLCAEIKPFLDRFYDS